MRGPGRGPCQSVRIDGVTLCKHRRFNHRMRPHKGNTQYCKVEGCGCQQYIPKKGG